MDLRIQAEERRLRYSGAISQVDDPIRAQYDAEFNCIGYFNDNTPGINEDCKFILVGTEADVDISLNYIRNLDFSIALVRTV
ncbi:hypothetical protein GGI01_001518 [Coemansia sp. RSA 376]|nr:hypothetical protein GGI01_001518 [Coemansia sp. RSA 376]